MATRKIARDARTGRFTSTREAHQRPASTVVETRPVKVRKPRK